ncbi:MFS transporter [Chryseobacterium indologenes]|uniref:MFS transporter n=1 Tax=Chryseobacterium indologenes TaxID=253 RepID=UPI0003E07CDB|nr:MFS transporter [Chryseobacterium indologenes]AYZ35872.1 MFS transporter [Chryseobacterium indologenes]MBF6644652.1 MFS transporter [Chryseobacterium indologenes]MBU3048162.1 MFS transporter [Chryseobacterium indologenes]MEB4759647.1 MFS transporter [Chryseobacterium indologenes]QPQ51263.1 MFS transporter [Chryseobacterium indologenes]
MKRSIYVLALGAFGIITTEFGVVGILPTLSRQFGVSIDTAGWLLSAFAITVAVSSPFITSFTNKINRKFLLCLVMSIFVLSNIISAFSTNFTMLMIARILPAVLHPLFWNISIAIAFKEKGAKGVSTVMLGLSLATVLGIPMTTYAADLFHNWKASFFLSSAISLIAFIGLLLFIPSIPAEKEKSAQNQFIVLKNPFLWMNLISTIGTLAAMFSSYTYLTTYLEEITRMNGAQISVMLLLFGGMGTLGNWLMGLALHRNVQLTTRVFLVLLITVQIFAYFLGGIFIPMILIVSLWGMIHTGGFLVSNIRTTQTVPHHALEFVNSLLTSSFNIGISLGAFLGGIVSSHYGVHHVLTVSILLLSVTLVLSFFSFPKNIAEKKDSDQSEFVTPACERT